jgi:hypothetical protein
VTWGSDDNLYVAWGDGGGFGGGDHDGRVAMGIARVEGFPPRWRGVNVNGGKNPEHEASFPKKGKASGVLFINGILYTLVNLQDGKWPDVNHVLAWSTNSGATWSKADWLFPRGAGNFQPAIFLNAGKDYSGLPGSTGLFVYVYGSKPSGRGRVVNGSYLARAPTNRLRDHAAWEFFLESDLKGGERWTGDFREAQPVFVDSNGGGASAVVYAPALKRYLLTSFHGGPGQLGVFDSPAPWGPWTTVCYLEDFAGMGASGEGLVCSFPQKWMASDGKSLWCIFSCYGGSAKRGINAHDRFNLLEARLRLISEGDLK